MSPEPTPTPVVATITGRDLLDKLEQLSQSFNGLSTKLDDIPAAVKDHEERLRVQESRHCVTWAQLGAVVTVLCTVFGVAAAFLAIR